jgi:hypothetical protein
MVAASDSRFYARTSAGKYALDVTEIRSAFLHGEELPARIRTLRYERLGVIASDEAPIELAEGGRVVLHIIPFAAVGHGARADIHAWGKLSPLPLSKALVGRHFNADGHLGFDGTGQGPHRDYVQLLRSGVVEAVTVYDHVVNEIPVMNIWYTESQITSGVERYLAALGAIGVEVPISVSLSLVGVRGYGLVPSAARDAGGRAVVTRDIVTLPDIVVDDLKPDAPAMLRPIFDALWQTFGMPRSLCYDADGNWDPNFRW